MLALRNILLGRFEIVFGYFQVLIYRISVSIPLLLAPTPSIVLTPLNIILGQGEIDFEDFCVLMARMEGDAGSEDAYDETRETFKAFDNKGNNKIRISDMKSVLENLSVKLTSSELSGILAELELSGMELDYSGKYLLLLGTRL